MKNKKAFIVFLAIFLLSFAFINVAIILNAQALADEPGLNCRETVYKLNGVWCIDCYSWENPPYWGCIGCPWSTCD